MDSYLKERFTFPTRVWFPVRTINE